MGRQLHHRNKDDNSIDCESRGMCTNEDKFFIKAVLYKFIEKLNIIE